MCDRKHPDQLLLKNVSNVKGENLQIHSPVALTQPRQQGIFSNPIKRRHDLTVKPNTQIALLSLIAFDLRSELGVRLGVQFYPHEWKRLSIFFLTSSSCTPLTLPERSSTRRRSISLSQASCTPAALPEPNSESSNRIRASLSRCGPGNSAASSIT